MTISKLPQYIQVDGKTWSAILSYGSRGVLAYIGKRAPVPQVRTHKRRLAPTYGIGDGWWDSRAFHFLDGPADS